MKYISILYIALIIFSCKENNEKSNKFYNWEFIKSQVHKDSLIKELGYDLDNYDGIIINKVNYNLFGDNELYRQRINSYFNYDNNINNISSLKINYNQILKDRENSYIYEDYFKSNERIKNIDFMNNGNSVEFEFININKDYSIPLDTLDGDYILELNDYNFDISSLFLSNILRLNDFEIYNSGIHLNFFNEDNTTLSLSALKSEIEKYYSLSDTLVFIFESQHIKTETFIQDDKKYLFINKEIYPVRLTYLPD